VIAALQIELDGDGFLDARPAKPESPWARWPSIVESDG
jgi:hypothetical protein